MTGHTLLVALERTLTPVKVLSGDTVVAILPASVVASLCRDALFVGSGSKRKVKSIRPLAVAEQRIPDPAWQPGWRQTKAPVLQPSIEYMRRCIA